MRRVKPADELHSPPNRNKQNLSKLKEVAMVRTAQPLVAMFILAAAVFVTLSGGCGSKNNGLPGDDGTSGDDDSGTSMFGTSSGGGNGSSGGGGGSSGSFVPTGDSGVGAMCPAGSPLSCYVNMNCSGGGSTNISGKVYDPAGKNPLQNVVVFVPNDVSTLPVISQGTGAGSCSSCDTSIGDYVAFTFTGPDGSFTLKNVPTGTNVPLVLQIGKWRRVITVPNVKDCGNTALPSSGTGQARLPANHKEGDMPQMALLTGGLDDLGCFLTRMGIQAAEYTAPHAGGRLDIYQGLGLLGNGPGLSNGGTPGNCTNTSCPLWASTQSFEKYDIVLLACEGDTYDSAAQVDGGITLGGGRANVTTGGKQALHDWLNEGGKVFATHFHYTWFQNGPADFQTVANWKGYSLGTGTCNNCTIDTTFTGGQDFNAWLKAVGAITTGGINLTGVADSVGLVKMGTTDRWIYDPASPNDTKYLSFNTPIGGIATDAGEANGKQYCGKAVFTDLHAGGAPSGDVPGSCKAADLSAQEKALEYLFFDLSACVHDESKPPPNPPMPPK
jgi:hypothetical protein